MQDLINLCHEKQVHFCARTDRKSGYFLHLYLDDPEDTGVVSLAQLYGRNLSQLASQAIGILTKSKEETILDAAKALIKQMDLSNWVETENGHSAKNLKALSDLRKAVENFEAHK